MWLFCSIHSKVGEIKCCKETKIPAPPNEYHNIPQGKNYKSCSANRCKFWKSGISLSKAAVPKHCTWTHWLKASHKCCLFVIFGSGEKAIVKSHMCLIFYAMQHIFAIPGWCHACIWKNKRVIHLVLVFLAFVRLPIYCVYT